MKKTRSILGAIILSAFVLCSCGGGTEQQAADNMKEIEHQVAVDAEKQYEIAKDGGDATEAYVHAGLVAAAYLQANDEVNYKKWKAIEKEEGVRAGVAE